ncbi:hypothetical protein VTO42DRAFT_5470 [Malbranchea cinnamomea]
MKRITRPVSYMLLGAAGGGASLYLIYRPRNIPGSDPAAVPPPRYDGEGRLVPPSFPAIKTRSQQIAELKKSSRDSHPDRLAQYVASLSNKSQNHYSTSEDLEHQPYDLLVIGGGATGSGIALDAATRGLKVALVERDDFSSGTSSKSTKLVHGGVRYLEKAVWEMDYNQYSLVKEALKERKYFLHTAPHLSLWLPIMVPVQKWWQTPYFWAGTKLYDFLAGSEGIESSYFLPRSKALDVFPMLKKDSIFGALVYYGDIVAPSSGVHVVLPGYYSPANMGLVDPATSDGRVIFFLPWQGNTIAGTTDSSTEITANPVPSERDINWILSEIRGYLAPDINLRRSDVLAAWSGIRPLVRDPKAKNTESLVRSHLVTISESGLLTCAGGKWTTYRQMAEDAVNEAIKHFDLRPRPVAQVPDISGSGTFKDSTILDGSCKTHQVRLIGAHGFSKTLFINLIQHFGLATDVAKHLTESYGDRAWTVTALSAQTNMRFPIHGVRLSPLYPFIDGEVRYAVRQEYAQTAIDVLARRTRLAFLNAQAALEALPMVIDLMAEELNWDDKRKELEWGEAVRFLTTMGLPTERLYVTRKDVEERKPGTFDEVERELYTGNGKFQRPRRITQPDLP